MIDLSRSTLPNALVVDGRVCYVDTSFRTWIKFEQCMSLESFAWPGIFEEEEPEGDWVPAAIEFLLSENATPRRDGRGGARLVDYVLDGELIVAAFQQAYGIDLTAEDMHWHRFKALLLGVPQDTALARVMAIRAYETPRDMTREARDAEMRRRRDQWSLPDHALEAEKEAVNDWFDAWAAS